MCQRRRKMQLEYEPRVCRSTRGTRGRGDGERRRYGDTYQPPSLPPAGAMISIRFWSQVLRQSGTHDWPAPRHARTQNRNFAACVNKTPRRPDRIMIRNRSAARPSIRRYTPRSIKIATKKCVTTPRTAFPREIHMPDKAYRARYEASRERCRLKSYL